MPEYNNKQYFVTIKTTGNSDQLDNVLSEHNEKLNNYQRYGIAITNKQWEVYKFKEKVKNANREIEHMEGSLVNHNNYWHKVTVLCCEDEQEGEDKEK